MISASSFLLWNISFLLIDIFNFTTLHITSNYCMQTRTRRYEKISSRNSVALALIESVILTKDEAKCVPIRNQKFIIIASKHGKKKSSFNQEPFWICIGEHVELRQVARSPLIGRCAQ